MIADRSLYYAVGVCAVCRAVVNHFECLEKRYTI